MKNLTNITILALLFSTGLFSKESKDRALFRYDNNVVFLSEARVLVKQLDKFRCLNKNWISLELTKLTDKSYPRLPKLPFEKKALNEEREFINRFIGLQKLKSFAKEQLVKIESADLAKINKRSCFPGGHQSWSEEVKDLVKLEFYFQSRYIKDSKNKVEQKQRLESFYKTISRKSDNVLYF